MTVDVPQDILDALTDVAMPRLPPERPRAGGDRRRRLSACPSTATAASSSAAARPACAPPSSCKRRGGDVAIVSQSAWGGTSACSGSDKQTLHTANTADRGDDYKAMARAIRAGGAMDEDTAYVEAVGSSRAMASLQYLGLPLPQDPLGGTLRYQTDHDEVGRATSCGPRTSRLMVKVLAEEAIRLGIPFCNHTTAVKILTEGEGASRRVCGVLTVRPKQAGAGNPFGLVLFQCPVLVLAAGGPGELYRDSVYPNGCFGSLGLALDAGIELVNLTESQFGIGTRREGFPWNLSGTYVQALPHIYSVDAERRASTTSSPTTTARRRSSPPTSSARATSGRSTPRGCSTSARASSTSRSTARRRPGAASSWTSTATRCRSRATRRSASTASTTTCAPTSARAGATQALPIDRLRHMNPLAIELYRRYKVDIAAEPLEFAVNNQHMNGGIAVDTWGRSSLPGAYAVGEAAGTHGVTRPGGAALNAGQVFGTRAAEHIAASGRAKAAAGRRRPRRRRGRRRRRRTPSCSPTAR